LDLRQEIAKRYGKHITEDNILVFAGGQVALQTAALALSSECHTITFTPGYQSTVEAPTHAGSRVTRVELKASSGWQIDPSAVAEAIQPGDTRYMVINEPFNPAGTLMSKSKQSELVAVAAQHNIYLMCDEAYRLLEHDPADRLPSMCDAYDRGISCVTMSKPWGACGVTIGWLYGARFSTETYTRGCHWFPRLLV
jgi:aspartate/methionine/tyrosine aminotransferase